MQRGLWGNVRSSFVCLPPKHGGKDVLGRLKTIAAPPPPETKVAIVGENDIYHWENLVEPFLGHKIMGPRPPPPSPLRFQYILARR